MKAAWVRSERDSEVCQAARGWHDAGAIDTGALAGVEALYPAPWPAPPLIWSALVFFFVSFAAVALLAAIAIGHVSLTVTAFLLAAVLTFAAERLRPSASTVAAASGAACAFWAVACLLIGVLDASDWSVGTLTRFLLIATAAWAAAAWRWGYPAFAAFAGVSFFLFLARFSHGRALWLVLGAALAAATSPFLDRAALAPSHRRSVATVLAVCLVAVYVAVNPYSLEHSLVESIADWRPPVGGPTTGERVGAAVATGLFPVLLLAWGTRSRRVLPLDLGVVFAALSLATMRYYVHIGPLWTVLAVGGAGLVGLALAVHRWLSRSPGRQRGGFTAEALFENEERQQMLGAVGVAVAFGPETRVPSPSEPGAFRGGGGSSGGAGSTGSF